MKKNRLLLVSFPFFIFAVSLLYRLWGLNSSHPFWVDEFSSAIQAQTFIKNGLSSFTNPHILIEFHNITTYVIIAVFFKIFGAHEWVARLPFAIIGAFIPVLVFFLTKKLSDTKTAIAASLLTSFSYFEITWSRQARGYVLLQLIILLSTILYFNIRSKKTLTLSTIMVALILVIIGILTHAFYYVFIFSVVLHFFLSNRSKFIYLLKQPYLYVLAILLLLLTLKTGMLNVFSEIYKNGFFVANNVWYYHSFLWREYALISFLALIGIILTGAMKRKEGQFFGVYIVSHLLFICFFFAPYTSRYVLPVFPFFLILTCFTFSAIAEYCAEKFTTVRQKKVYILLPILLSLFIIANGDKFVTKPKTFYSVNHDFREIALIDYHQIYSVIIKKGKLDEKKTAVIDTWTPRLEWYLGIGFSPDYNFRWVNESGLVNGLPKKTDYIVNKQGEKELLHSNHILFIGEVTDLKKAVQKYPRGFIFIDDASLPKNVIEFAQKNFKKELYLDHYPLDDNPYSIWPATLYSWGI
jgi:hypothetical protein